MEIHFYQPVHPVLKKYIQGYYFISKDESNQSIRYLTFPNNFFILSACQDVEIISSENSLEIFRSPTKNLMADIVSRCTSSTEIFYAEPINEITLYFKPLGIYHFFNSENSALLDEELLHIPYFQETINIILNESDREVQIEKLENYWLSKFVEKDLSSVEKIIQDLEGDLSILDIAKKNGITRQYVNKITKRYVAKPASEYRKVYRFRNALMQNKQMKNLTELSYENLFYDQSHFIKDFKELTQITPSIFFKKVNTEQNNVWLFI
ncbi:helix-turn-helix domain-containing protein [Chryseobacterium paridis]|uniref:AraC family transcriptional regulator n=1 Tax=Chryseobacterium paridis TaxID=2800328 RepID=A0ABS1FWF5_9FLAO|nr:helix-turn-helix domain-containing protein [Chryseobacterium paridis]MBK1896583.1 AraC family transcriptional regulator [Chryseobacterium paridis]